MPNIQLMQGDCIELMKSLPNQSIDMILCDLPYGTTKCKWDRIIPFEPLWEQYKRIIKDNGAMVLFSAQPFTTDLIQSNRKMFRYEIIWEKTMATGFLNARKMPLKGHENILVFYKKLPTYNPIKTVLTQQEIEKKGVRLGRVRVRKEDNYQQSNHTRASVSNPDDGTRFPRDVIKFSNWNRALFGNTENATKHPTQKPVELLEYLIQTYTNEGDTVLNNCMGSGSTGVACVNTGRNFIGMELDENYFGIAHNRINKNI